VPDRQSKRWLPDDALVAATDWLWLGQTLGELVEPLFAEGRSEAWVFAPAGVPDEDLKSYSGATHATDASSAWWESTVQYIVDEMKREGATWVVADSCARPTDPILSSYVTTAERLDVDDEVYWLARQPAAEHVEGAWHSGDSAAGVMGVLTRSDVPSGPATASALRDVAANASHVVISAYDHSGRPIVYKRRNT
jgi:hypothetical protein